MNKILTRSMEDYLEIIYIMEQNNKVVGITDIANALSFSKASVNRAINVLKSEDMVLQEKYKKISLTEKGRKIALEVYEKHKILSEFFIKILKVSSKTAEIDACKAEHVLSIETLESIKNFLESRNKNRSNSIEK